MQNVKELIQSELDGIMGRGFVATPECQEDLVAFAQANGGSMDMVLMQMAAQYGAKLAYENILEQLPATEARITPDNRVAAIENMLSHIWNMGRGANTLDTTALAQSIVADLFGDTASAK